MKLLFAVALILSACGVRCQDFSCLTSTENNLLLSALAPTCLGESVNVADIARVCTLPPTSPCRMGLNAIYTSCGQSIDDTFCNIILSAPTPTTDSIETCFYSNSTSIAMITAACQGEGLDITTIFQMNPSRLCMLDAGGTCERGVFAIFSRCGLPLNEFCSMPPTSISITNAPTTADPFSACFMREETVAAFAQLFFTCQTEGVDLATLFSDSGEESRICSLPMGNCRSELNNVFSSCNVPLDFFCIISSLPTPSPSQQACVANAETTRAADIERECGSSQDFFNIDLLRARCAAGSSCRVLLNEIFIEPCSYDPLSPICNNLPSSTVNPTTDSVTECFSRESTLTALGILEQTCQNELNTNSDMDDEIFDKICTLDKDSPCRSGTSRIFDTCGTPFDAFCVFENLPTPSPTQQQCLDNALQTRAADIMRECGIVEVNSFDDARSVCAKTGCRNLFRSLYSDGCNYNVVDTVCDSLTTDGAVNHYAVPLVVLIAVLMSVLF